MIKHVTNDTISTILSDPKTYIIPKYQREYTWGKQQWSQLFDDITENDHGYFLGSIICVNGAENPNENELIDGQQRLTTLSILLLAIYSKLKELKNEFIDDEDLLTDYNNIRKEFFKKGKDANGKKYSIPRLQLQIQNSNKDDYETLLRENEISIGAGTKPKHYGLRGITKAFNYFTKSIDEYLEREEGDNVELLFELAEKFNSAVLVVIEVDTHKDAYMLFESLNNRGVPLSAIDLIKNILIRESEKDNATDETYENWKIIIHNLSDNYSIQERFFRQYYNAFRDRLNEPYSNSTKLYELGYLATKTTLLEIYERIIKEQGYRKFVKDMLISSKLYSVIINNNIEEEKIYQESLRNLERIGGAPSYLLILYLLEQQSKLNILDTDIEKIINLLIKFFVRRNITDFPNTRNLNKIFMDIVSLIRTNDSNILPIIYSEIVKNSADDSTFETKLRGPIYLDNDMATRFILCRLEEQNQTKEIYSDFWKRDKSNKFIWTIEHIFPEGDNIPVSWVDMIANGDSNLATQYLRTYVHTIGNLTLTGYNQNLSNLSFDKKMERTNKEGIYVGYRNGLKLNDDVVTETSWSIDKIQKRTDRLVCETLNLFRF